MSKRRILRSTWRRINRTSVGCVVWSIAYRPQILSSCMKIVVECWTALLSIFIRSVNLIVSQNWQSLFECFESSTMSQHRFLSICDKDLVTNCAWRFVLRTAGVGLASFIHNDFDDNIWPEECIGKMIWVESALCCSLLNWKRIINF